MFGARLERRADVVRELVDDHRTVRDLGPMVERDRLADVDPPLRRKRDNAERAERRKEGRDREVREAQRPAEVELRPGMD